MSVRFKFKNDLEFSAVPCDGFHISVRDLKKWFPIKRGIFSKTLSSPRTPR